MIEQICTPLANSALPDDAPHILLVLDQLSATLGGGERVALRLAALLPEYGYRASILTLSLHPQSPALRGPVVCPIFLLPLRRTWDGRALLAALALRRFLREQRVRLVQTFFESSDLWVGAVTKTVPSVRLLWSRRDMGILRTAKHHLAYRLLARMPDHVLAVSEQVREYCIEKDRVPPERITTIYNGVDVLRARPQDRARPEDGPLVILSVGNIRPVKGHDVLLEAAAIVHRRFPEAIFAVAGEPVDPTYFSLLQSRVAQQAMENVFRFLGGVDDLGPQLAGATLFAMPSRSEGFSNAIVEAMLSSLPVVATAVGGNAEAVLDGVNGLIVPPENAAALAEAICSLLADRSHAREIGVAGRERARRLFTEPAMMEATTAVYHQLLIL